jgi:hypothetical protein
VTARKATASDNYRDVRNSQWQAWPLWSCHRKVRFGAHYPRQSPSYEPGPQKADYGAALTYCLTASKASRSPRKLALRPGGQGHSYRVLKAFRYADNQRWALLARNRGGIAFQQELGNFGSEVPVRHLVPRRGWRDGADDSPCAGTPWAAPAAGLDRETSSRAHGADSCPQGAGGGICHGRSRGHMRAGGRWRVPVRRRHPPIPKAAEPIPRDSDANPQRHSHSCAWPPTCPGPVIRYRRG